GGRRRRSYLKDRAVIQPSDRGSAEEIAGAILDQTGTGGNAASAVKDAERSGRATPLEYLEYRAVVKRSPTGSGAEKVAAAVLDQARKGVNATCAVELGKRSDRGTALAYFIYRAVAYRPTIVSGAEEIAAAVLDQTAIRISAMCIVKSGERSDRAA